jgi:hypothetical protein
MTSIDIFWRGEETFSTIQNVDTIEAALAKYNAGPTRYGLQRSLADIERYETIPDGQITKFGMMFKD